MKILFILIVFLASQTVAAQQKPVMTREAKAAMDKELAEMEKEDPEMAKKIREMMGQKTVTQPKTTAPKPAAFKSPFTPIKLAVPPSTPTAAQSKDQLLWFNGRKINDSTIVTSTGTIAQFRKKKKEMVVQANTASDMQKKLADKLATYEGNKQKLLQMFDKSQAGFFHYPIIATAIEVMDSDFKFYMSAARNTEDLNFTPEEKEIVQNVTSSASLYRRRVDIRIEPWIMRFYNEVLDLIKDHPPLDFDPPPNAMSEACVTCDKKQVAAELKRVQEWTSKFSEYEGLLNRRACLVLRGLEETKKNSFTEEELALRETIMQKMLYAQELARSRFREKLKMLEEQYGKSAEYVPYILKQYATYHRFLTLTDALEEETPLVVIVNKYLTDFEKYLYDQFLSKNHSFVLNVPLMMSVYSHQTVLLGTSIGLMWYWSNLEKYNRFSFDMTVDVKAESETLVASAAIDTKPGFYVSLGRYDCGYMFHVFGVDYRSAEEKKLYVPFVARSGAVKRQLEEDERWVTYPYRGPTELIGVLPTARLDICNEKPDTIMLSIFRYLKELTAADHGKLPKDYTIDFIGYINLLVMNTEGGEASKEEMKKIGMDIMSLYSATLPTTGNKFMDNMHEAHYKFTQAMLSQENLFSLAISNKVKMLVDLHRSGDLLIRAEQDFDISHSIWNLSKAYVKLLVRHAPLELLPPVNVE